MRDCPACHNPVDGDRCTYCRPLPKRTGPPGGFAALYAKCQPKPRDPEAELERAAIQAEGV